MRTKNSTVLDASVTSSTDNMDVFAGPMSIQPVLDLITGNPTYTVEVSNDGTNFISYTRSSTNVAITKSIEITYNNIPWKFIRLTVTPGGGSTGNVYFYISQGFNEGSR